MDYDRARDSPLLHLGHDEVHVISAVLGNLTAADAALLDAIVSDSLLRTLVFAVFSRSA